MFREVRRMSHAFREVWSDLPTIIRVSAALEQGHRPDDMDLRTLNYPRTFDF